MVLDVLLGGGAGHGQLGAGGDADGVVVHQDDAAGPGVVAADVEQGAIGGDAGAVDDQVFFDGAGDVTHLELRVGLHRGVIAGVAQSFGVSDFQNAGRDHDGPGEGGVVIGQDQGADAILGQLHSAAAAQFAGHGQVGAGVDREELPVAGGTAHLDVEGDDFACRIRVNDDVGAG